MGPLVVGGCIDLMVKKKLLPEETLIRFSLELLVWTKHLGKKNPHQRHLQCVCVSVLIHPIISCKVSLNILKSATQTKKPHSFVMLLLKPSRH